MNERGGLSGFGALVGELWAVLRGEGDRRRKLAWLFSLLRPYRAQVALMAVALVAATAAGLAPPYLAGRAVDDGIGARDSSALSVIVIAFLASALVYWAATYAQTYLVGWVGQRALRDLRGRIYAHLQTMSIGFYTRRRPGVLISRMTNDVVALDSLISDGVVTLFSSLLTLIGVIVILVVLDLKLALVTFLTFPLLALASAIFRIVAADAYSQTREKIAAIAAHLQESLSAVRVVRSFGQEPRHIDEMSRLNEENRLANLRTVYLNASYFPAVEMLSAIGTAAILIVGGNRVIDSTLTVGVLIAFIGYLQTFFDPIQQISQLYTTYQQGMAALDKIFELLDTSPDMVDRPDAVDPGRLRGAIGLREVSFAYDETAKPHSAAEAAEIRWALRDLSLAIEPGQTVALVGQTGAGKSTLAKLVARFYDPQHGAVTIDGHDLRDLRAEPLRRQLGIVPQEGFLFSGSVRDNLAFGQPGAADSVLLAALEAIGGAEMLARLPDGLDSEVGERGSMLSAGERQLVAFARAMLADPAILILDEATSNVDVRTERAIERGLERLLAGRTALVIAHRLSTIRRADRIVVLSDGRMVEAGSHRELIEANGAYAALHSNWSQSPEPNYRPRTGVGVTN